MVELLLEDIEQVKSQEAAKVMAELAVWSVRTSVDENVAPDKWNEFLSAYALATAYGYDLTVPEYQQKLAEGLVIAGANRDASIELAGRLVEPIVLRKIFSLYFFKKDLKPYGIRVKPNKKWLEPDVFIDSILNLK